MATNQTTSTQHIANKLVEFCRTGQFDKAYDELFAEDATATEPEDSQMPEKTVKGLDAFREKDKQFMEGVKEVHGSKVSEPLIAGKFITFTFDMDITMKDGNRMNISEVALYKVENDKIVSQQFFY